MSPPKEELGGRPPLAEEVKAKVTLGLSLRCRRRALTHRG